MTTFLLSFQLVYEFLFWSALFLSGISNRFLLCKSAFLAGGACFPLIAFERGSAGSTGSVGSTGVVRRIKISSAAEF